MNIYYTNDNTHIENSYLLVTRKAIREEVLKIEKERKAKGYQATRTTGSYTREWKGHNRLYKLGLFKDHTKDVDLEEPSKWYLEIIWLVLGGI